MPDFGGINDGQCEYSFFSRCPHPAVRKVTFGQHKAWTYNYCEGHAQQMEHEKKKEEENDA